MRLAGAARFGRAQLLEQLGADHQAGVLDLALTGHGNAVVAWTGDRVRAAETDASGRFGTPRDLSPPLFGQRAHGAPLGALTDVAGAPDGARVAVWTAGSAVQAAYAAPGAAFGPPEDVSTDGEADAARAAFPRAGAQPVVVWRTRRAGGTNVQEAARSG